MNLVTLEQAQELAAMGYAKPTEYIWDSYNPQYAGNPKGPSQAWRISKPRGRHYDFQCCLRAPSKVEYYRYKTIGRFFR